MDDKQIIALYPARAEEAISETADKYALPKHRKQHSRQ